MGVKLSRSTRVPRHRAVLPTSALALVAAGLALGLTGARADQMSCNALSTQGLFTDTTVRSTTLFAADAAQKRPAFCEVAATISPVPGSAIGVVYRLPDDWNGKLLGAGGGGWMGNISMNPFSNVPEGLKRHYATMQTDGGHAIDSPFSSSWVGDAAGTPDQPKIDDFGFRAIHLMTTVGKAVAAKYYGHAQSHTYFQGCSTGGRQAMMETQRYPEDYDGLIAGAPVHTLAVQTSAVLRDNNFVDPARRLTPELFALVKSAALDACDAKDGLKDGIVTDPRACSFDPAVLACKAGTAASCLTPAQVDAVRVAYKGVTAANGRVAAYPLTRGAEDSWSRYIGTGGVDPIQGGGMGGLRALLFGDANFDLTKFDVERDLPKVRDSALAKAYEANDPNISAFVAHGGKLLIWQGFDDAGPSAIATIEYFDAVQKSTKGKKLADSVKLFIAPGVGHCGGGTAPDKADWLTTMESWVEKNQAPKEVIATKTDLPRSWPLCPYPALPHYKGKGAVNDAKNYSCK